MTRPSHRKQRRGISWTDEAGREYGDTWHVKPPPSLGLIPLDLRLVDVVDAANDLVAVLVREQDGAPAILHDGVRMWALLDSGLVGVMLAQDAAGRWVAGTADFLDAEPSIEVSCHGCRGRFSLTAAELRAKASTRGQRVARLTV